MTIFDLVKSTEIAAYWNEMTKDRTPYLGEEIFPNEQKLGLDLKWIKGSAGIPVVLSPSAFGVKAMPRDRIGFDKLSAEMPFFKESMYINEELRQELNKVMETGNQAYIDAVIKRVFADNVTLIEAAAAQRERLRMQALTTGVISITANGQKLYYDYGVTDDQKPTAAVSWATATTDIIADIRTWQDTIEDATGVRPNRAVCSRKTWGYLLNNTNIKKSIYVLSAGEATVSDARLKQYLMDELGLSVVVYTKRYKNEAGTATAYVPDDTFILFPEGALGKTWFGTTPEQSDLMSGSAANVSIVDTGVAVTTIKETDPVTVDTKVSMICLPSFEEADKIIIAGVIPEEG
jgi:hypothetical protein